METDDIFLVIHTGQGSPYLYGVVYTMVFNHRTSYSKKLPKLLSVNVIRKLCSRSNASPYDSAKFWVL